MMRINLVYDTSNACRNYTLNYNYDELGNILQIQNIAQNGNWTRNYFYPSNSNKLIGHTSGQTEYTYDAAGNMLTMPHLNEMGWDENNMLIEADLGGGGTAYYRYDSSGNRVRKVIVNGNVKKERLYVGEWELWQQSSADTLQTERETLSIADDQKSFLQLETLTVNNGNTVATPNTNWRYQYDNHLGSAALELDSSANIISYEEYYPFGSTSYRSGKSAAEVSLKRYRYCGKERDEETGLYYYGARYYAAWIGRFISVDPLAEKFPQLTPYNYVGNKPITHKDLEGLQSTGDNEVKNVEQDNTRVIKPRVHQSDLQRPSSDQLTVKEKAENAIEFAKLAGEMGSNVQINEVHSENFHQVGIRIEQNDVVSTQYFEWDNSINNNSKEEPNSGSYSLGPGPLSTGLEEFGKRGGKLTKSTTPLKSTGKIKYYDNAWSGNRYIKTKNVFSKRLTKKIAKEIPYVGWGFDALELIEGYQQDDGIGINTATQGAGILGGMAGGWAGAKVGALAGAALGSIIPGVGTAIGGIIGGVVGGIIGAWAGEIAAEEATKEILIEERNNWNWRLKL